MSLDKFIELIPPPAEPVEPGRPEAWREIEQQLGFALPSDYKKYIETYGTGSVDDFLLVFNPFSSNRYVSLPTQIEDRLDAQRQFTEMTGDAAPWPLHPDPGGLLPWACTDNGDVLFWLTEGAPDDWSIVVMEAHSDEWEQAPGPMSNFLLRVLSREYKCNIFPEGWPTGDLRFSTD